MRAALNIYDFEHNDATDAMLIINKDDDRFEGMCRCDSSPLLLDIIKDSFECEDYRWSLYMIFKDYYIYEFRFYSDNYKLFLICKKSLSEKVLIEFLRYLISKNKKSTLDFSKLSFDYAGKCKTKFNLDNILSEVCENFKIIRLKRLDKIIKDFKIDIEELNDRLTEKINEKTNILNSMTDEEKLLYEVSK